MGPGSAFSKYQLTPYCSSPASFTSATCASMCTCSGITSSRSMTSLIDRHACRLARTSSVLVSSTADTPTLSPPTSRVTAPLPCSRLVQRQAAVAHAAAGVAAACRRRCRAELVPLVSSTPESLISVEFGPGISDGAPLLLSELPPPAAEGFGEPVGEVLRLDVLQLVGEQLHAARPRRRCAPAIAGCRRGTRPAG